MLAANIGPAPPSATSAKSRGSKPLRTEFSSIDWTIEWLTIWIAPIEASSTLIPSSVGHRLERLAGQVGAQLHRRRRGTSRAAASRG